MKSPVSEAGAGVTPPRISTRSNEEVFVRLRHLVELLYVLFVGVGGTLISFNVDLPAILQISILVLAVEGGVVANIPLVVVVIIGSEFGLVFADWVGTAILVTEGLVYFLIAILNVAIVRRIFERLRESRD